MKYLHSGENRINCQEKRVDFFPSCQDFPHSLESGVIQPALFQCETHQRSPAFEA